MRDSFNPTTRVPLDRQCNWIDRPFGIVIGNIDTTGDHHPTITTRRSPPDESDPPSYRCARTNRHDRPARANPPSTDTMNGTNRHHNAREVIVLLQHCSDFEHESSRLISRTPQHRCFIVIYVFLRLNLRIFQHRKTNTSPEKNQKNEYNFFIPENSSHEDRVQR